MGLGHSRKVVQVVKVLLLANFVISVKVNEVEVHSLTHPEVSVSDGVLSTLNSDEILPFGPSEVFVFIRVKCLKHVFGNLLVHSESWLGWLNW